MKLIGTDGSIAASYTYDAWGNILSSSGTMAEKNPLRYRGYYYDSETGYYYLQSRYYDPTNRRFINADVYTSTGQGFTGTNGFAYCNNNPVRYEDDCGSLPTVFINTVRADTGATRPDNYVQPKAMSFRDKNSELINKTAQKHISENSRTELLYAGAILIDDDFKSEVAYETKIGWDVLSLVVPWYLAIPSPFTNPLIDVIFGIHVNKIRERIMPHIPILNGVESLPNGNYERYTLFIDTPCDTYGEQGTATTIIDFYWVWLEGETDPFAYVIDVSQY